MSVVGAGGGQGPSWCIPSSQGENLDQTLALLEALRALADARGVSVAQLVHMDSERHIEQGPGAT